MIIMGADTETTGLEKDAEIVESGFAIYDTSTNIFLALHSDLFKTVRWSAEAEAVNHIPREASQLGRDINRFNPWTLVVHYKPVIVVAHGKIFDKNLITQPWPEFNSIDWVCTQTELPHEKFIKRISSHRLQHLAVDYGIEAAYKHRALFDAMLCCQIAAKHDLEKIITQAKEPKYTITAWFDGRPNFNDPDFNTQKDYLKKANFHWTGTQWVKEMVPESKLAQYLSLATNKPGWLAKETPAQ